MPSKGDCHPVNLLVPWYPLSHTINILIMASRALGSEHRVSVRCHQGHVASIPGRSWLRFHCLLWLKKKKKRKPSRGDPNSVAMARGNWVLPVKVTQGQRTGGDEVTRGNPLPPPGTGSHKFSVGLRHCHALMSWRKAVWGG